MRFMATATSYIIVGILTNDEDKGGERYLNVQIYVIVSTIVSIRVYYVLYCMDIKYNNCVLQRIHPDKKSCELTEVDSDCVESKR